MSIGQTIAQIRLFFRFFKMAAIHHLGFVSACLDHPQRAFGGLYHHAKFGWNRYSSFDITQVLIFCELGVKTLIHASETRFWGIWHQNGELSHRDPHLKGTKAFPCVETRHMTCRSSKSVHRCGLCASRRIKYNSLLLSSSWLRWATVATVDMGPKEGDAVPLSRRAGTPSNTVWPGPRSTSVPSGVFIHPTIWPH